MKTPKLDNLILRWTSDTEMIEDEEANVIRVAVSEDIRAACKEAWQDGWAAGRESPVRIVNPYSKRKDG